VAGVENRALTRYRVFPNAATVVGTSKFGDVMWSTTSPDVKLRSSRTTATASRVLRTT
jgi:hypothetical protein